MVYKLKAALKDYIWGGTNLKTEWNKQTDLDKVAESWELSFHPDGTGVVVGGKYDGQKISDVVSKTEWGANCQDFPFFPVLNKIIDARSNLSVQVHPNDEYALKNEGQFGKTEMWHILSSEKGAVLYLGLNRTMKAEEFSQAISDNSIIDYLNAVPVHAGETYFIPSGTLHAIGAGITLFEVQQNSSLTYRVYDYGRLGADGKPRQLHVEKAKKVANLNKYVVPNPVRNCLLGSCKYFSAYRYNGSNEFQNDDSFVSITVVDGDIAVNGQTYKKGETLFATAGQKISVVGNGEYILTQVEKQ